MRSDTLHARALASALATLCRCSGTLTCSTFSLVLCCKSVDNGYALH